MINIKIFIAWHNAECIAAFSICITVVVFKLGYYIL